MRYRCKLTESSVRHIDARVEGMAPLEDDSDESLTAFYVQESTADAYFDTDENCASRTSKEALFTSTSTEDFPTRVLSSQELRAASCAAICVAVAKSFQVLLHGRIIAAAQDEEGGVLLGNGHPDKCTDNIINGSQKTLGAERRSEY
eukprot:scaffold10568_cov140-Skeletonema_dohrnii-CCMP3373.AAC.3